MKLQRYDVLLADPAYPDDPDHASEHTVTVLHGDQLRAELEGPRNGIPSIDKAAMHGITLWVWSALMRTHVIDEPFQVFLPRLLAFEDPDEGAEKDVDPTQPAAPTGSPSPSPSTTETSPDGSTPTVTTD